MPIVAANPFSNYSASPHAPPTGIVAITPSNTDDIDKVIRRLHCTTTAGNVKVDMINPGTGVITTGTFAIAVGEHVTGFFTRVYATGTTAVGFIGFY